MDNFNFTFFLAEFFKLKKFLNVSFEYLISYFKHKNIKIENQKNKEKEFKILNSNFCSFKKEETSLIGVYTKGMSGIFSE